MTVREITPRKHYDRASEVCSKRMTLANLFVQFPCHK